MAFASSPNDPSLASFTTFISQQEIGKLNEDSISQPMDFFLDAVGSESMLPSQTSLSPSSLKSLSQAPYSPPYTPPSLTPSTTYEAHNRPSPFSPATPTFSPIPEHEHQSVEGQFGSFSHSNCTDSPYNPRSELDPCAQTFVPTRAQLGLPPTLHRPFPRRIPSPLVIVPHMHHRPLISSAKSERFFATTSTTTDAHHPHHYSPHFSSGHVLNREFVRKYAPGGQIGIGAFGFVITARDKMLGREAAVKFIEKRKVPHWGWSNDPEMGRVPTEAVLLKHLKHPGIVNFLDLFEDKAYFYLVQELHGSPWRGRHSAQDAVLHQKDFSAPAAPEEGKYSGESGVQPHGPGHKSLPNLYEQLLWNKPALSIYSHLSASSSSSSSSSPPCSPVLPMTPSSPMTPPPGPRPNMGRRASHDLFECIEEHKRLSESQARYIFSQVVAVVEYLDSLGITHRDIKDENVLIDRSFRVKLIDFGAASCVDPRDPGPRPWYRTFRGTIAYAPAEILKESKCHQAEPAEIWALGVLLSYLLTGKSAFPTATDAAHGTIKLYNCGVRMEDDDALTSAPEENLISPSCWDLLTRCLDPNPQTRITISEVKAHPWLNTSVEC